ncbi:MAG: cation:proton antiporter [Candidatus Thorarchaeota archaeon]
MAFELMTIGAALVLAFAGAFILKRLGIPQTLGFMVAGIILGLTTLLTEDGIHSLQFFVSLALGLIGYNIGHELHSDNLNGGRIRRLVVIVMFEATAAFALVSFLTYLILQGISFPNPFPTAILFGAVASATAPAATADVIWESHCEGPVTSSLMFVLAADDIAAVILTNSAIAYALYIYSPGTMTLTAVMLEPIIGIILSVIVGLAFGYLFLWPVNREDDRGKLLELEIGMVLLLIGFIEYVNWYIDTQLLMHIHISDIFAAMVFGYIVRRNISSDKEPVPEMLERIMSPIVMIFFVLVGARMAQLLTATETLFLIIGVAILYLGGRTVAKYVGTAIGSKVVREVPAIQKYLGMCLLCQAGVALGLSFIIEENFVALGGDAAVMGTLILGVVAVSTMVLELVGPMSVKRGLSGAGELPSEIGVFEPSEITLVDIVDGEHCDVELHDAEDTEDSDQTTSSL